MTFRARLLIAIAIAALVPLVVLVAGVRREVVRRITAQDDSRVAAEARAVTDAIARESASIAGRLATLRASLADDDRFRLGAARREMRERTYVQDYAERAMRLAGLSMLQIQDDEGRIISSGHFPLEFDRLEPALPSQLSALRYAALVRARHPEGAFLALVRVDSLDVGGRRFHIVGGAEVDSAFLARFDRGDSLRVTLHFADSVTPNPTGHATQTISLPLVDVADGAPRISTVELVIAQPRTALRALLSSATRWIAAATLLLVAGVIVLSVWLSRQLSRPLADLASAASRIDLDAADVGIVAARDDEIGTVARRLGGLAKRLGASAERLRAAERRATVGDMARQVNHDIKNGLIPIRNVLRHLGDLSTQESGALAEAFRERRGTLDSSVSYLDTLARHYARLTPRIDRVPVDVNAIAREAVAAATVGAQGTVEARLAPVLPRVDSDPVVLRRIMDNLLRNGIESLDGKGGTVTLATSGAKGESVRIVIADTGRGMDEAGVANAFEDFYTTKPNGTGLGLSVVRRLVGDLGGAVHLDSRLGQGTTVTVELPA